ncbi:MAG: radical SAM protein [Methanomassiliicoccales archaeon]
MNILILNPPRLEHRISVIREDRCEITDRYAIIPPYSLITIASILRNNGHHIHFIDANGVGLSYDQIDELVNFSHFDILIFRFTPTTFDWDMRIAELSKRRNPNIMTIGICLTLHKLGKEVMKKAPFLDYYLPIDWDELISDVVCGISESHLSGLVGVYYRERGDIVFYPHRVSGKVILDWPMPAYDLLPDLRHYRPNAPINGNYMIMYSSKGCPFQCAFCTVARTRHKMRSVENIIRELEHLYINYNVRTVSFFDETFTISKPRLMEICNEIAQKMPNLRWYCNTRVNLVDEDILRIMREGGCRGISFGIESGSQRILDAVNKGTRVDDAVRAINMAKRAGLKVFASFIFGLPGENYESINETMIFIRSTLPHGAQFNVAVPYPGTDLYEYARKTNMLDDDVSWTQLYQHKAILRTSQLSQNELERLRKNAYIRFYLNPKWLLQNVIWVINHVEDLSLGMRYYVKCMLNIMLHGMEHAH